MQPSAGDKPDRMQSQEVNYSAFICTLKVKDWIVIHVVDAVVGSNWCTSFRDSNQARSKQSED